MCDESNQKVTIGNDCLFSDNILLRPSDGHAILQIDDNKVINYPGEIKIGNHVWLGFQVVVLKHANIPDGCVVGLRSIVTTGSFDKNSVIVGQPAKTTRKNIKWTHENTEQIENKQIKNTEEIETHNSMKKKVHFFSLIKKLLKSF